jgi:hypothetical protein
MLARVPTAAHEACHAVIAGVLGKAVYSIDVVRRAVYHDESSDLVNAIVLSIPGASGHDVATAELICADLGINPEVPAVMAAALADHYAGFIADLAAEVHRAGTLDAGQLRSWWNNRVDDDGQ